ncbi:MAG: type II secretion system protein [Phycisphaerales bacterium]
MTNHVRFISLHTRRFAGFTLIELLVVISIIALLVGILLPALGAARRSAQDLKCGSNIRQLGIGLTSYATDYSGNYPPNWNNGPQADWRFWYDDERIGNYMPDSIGGGTVNTTVGGGGFVCPRDENSLRSYAMNFWGSSELNFSKFVEDGYTFQADAKNATQVLLLADTFACWGNENDGWFTAATVGEPDSFVSPSAGAMFGGNPSRVVSAYSVPQTRFGPVHTELSYYRHGSGGTETDPKGAVNIAYVDGHVAKKTDSDLYDSSTGLSKDDTYWLPPANNHNDYIGK